MWVSLHSELEDIRVNDQEERFEGRLRRQAHEKGNLLQDRNQFDKSKIIATGRKGEDRVNVIISSIRTRSFTTASSDKLLHADSFPLNVESRRICSIEIILPSQRGWNKGRVFKLLLLDLAIKIYSSQWGLYNNGSYSYSGADEE